MPAKRTRRAAKRQQSDVGVAQEMTRMAGARRRKTGSQRATQSAQAGRARIARSSKASGARRLIAEARDMAQSVGATTLHAAAGVANRTQEKATAFAGQVWDNKWPALLIGAGATWLIVDAVRGQANDAPARRRTRPGSSFARRAVSTIADAGRGAGERVGQFVRENPALAGATTLGVGLAVGMALPSTSAENTLLGETRDAVMERAKDAARGTVRNVRNVAQNMTRLGGGGR